MNEKPIIFSTEMVKAILEDKKTQTWRVADYEVPDGFSPIPLPNGNWAFQKPGKKHLQIETTEAFNCPYGQAGDRLWVRETWAHDDLDCKDPTCGNIDHIWWKANEDKIVADSFAGDARWRPSIFMPRWASRIDLAIVKIRVERVWQITSQDVRAEGIFVAHGSDSTYYDTFMLLWNSINSKRGYGWDTNPWVWVIEFKKLERWS